MAEKPARADKAAVPAEKPAAKRAAAGPDNARVVKALKAHLDGIGDEGAKVAFLHSIGVSDERDTEALLRREEDDEAGAPSEPTA